MLYRELDSLFISEKGWAIHMIPLKGRGIAAFLTHSEHHPSETVWTEVEFVELLQDDPEDKILDSLDHWTKSHDSNPFFTFCSSIQNGMYCLETGINRSKKAKRFDEDLKEWKKFIDKIYYRP